MTRKNAMDTEQAKHQILRVFEVMPSYREWIKREADKPKQTFNRWCEMLTNVNERDLIAVVDLIVQGAWEPTSQYEKPDRLPFRLREAALRRADKRSGPSEQERIESYRRQLIFRDKNNDARNWSFAKLRNEWQAKLKTINEPEPKAVSPPRIGKPSPVASDRTETNQ